MLFQLICSYPIPKSDMSIFTPITKKSWIQKAKYLLNNACKIVLFGFLGSNEGWRVFLFAKSSWHRHIQNNIATTDYSGRERKKNMKNRNKTIRFKHLQESTCCLWQSAARFLTIMLSLCRLASKNLLWRFANIS